MKAPFPYFGGKSKVASLVWQRFGDVKNYVEPFCGSAAMLLARPGPLSERETINDACGFVANFWRAVQADPDAVAAYADCPLNENEIHARHAYVVSQTADLQAKLEGDPEYFDVRIAGYWLHGISSYLGTYGEGTGPWRPIEGKLVCDPVKKIEGRERGISRRLPQANFNGVHANGPAEKSLEGLADRWADHLQQVMRRLRDRLRRVRVCSGPWERVLSKAGTTGKTAGAVGIFFDPPYAPEADCDQKLYVVHDGVCSHKVREWCIANGDNPQLRICLAGYDSEHQMPDTWEVVEWTAGACYGGKKSTTDNRHRERLWFSPHCLAGA